MAARLAGLEAAVRGLWRAALQLMLPHEWVPLPVKRALMTGLAASLVAVADSIQATPDDVWPLARRLGASEDDAPDGSETLRRWLLRVLPRREGETLTEWLSRALPIAIATLAHVRPMRVTVEEIVEAAEEAERITRELEQLLRGAAQET